MEVNEYMSNAVRTEARIDAVKANRKLVENALAVFVSAGEFVDMIKKNVFYGKPLDPVKFRTQWHSALEALRHLEFVPLDENEQQFVQETFNVDPRVFHAITGLASEASELIEALDLDKQMDRTNLLEEVGDCCWYSALLTDSLSSDLGHVMDINIQKLQTRFPDKFDSKLAVDRNVENERIVLDQGFED